MTTVYIVHILTVVATYLAATIWFKEKLIHIYESIHLKAKAYLVFGLLLIILPVGVANILIYIIDKSLILSVDNGPTIIFYIILFVTISQELKILSH